MCTICDEASPGSSQIERSPGFWPGDPRCAQFVTNPVRVHHKLNTVRGFGPEPAECICDEPELDSSQIVHAAGLRAKTTDCV